MKSLLIIPLFLILFSCDFKSKTSQPEKNSILKGQEDTIIGVHVEVVGADYIQKEYFVITKSDTSSFSCIITKNKLSGKMSMHYKYAPYEKMPALIFSDDTAAVVEHRPVKEFNHKLTYKDQIRELKLILDYASKDYDLSKLSSVRLAMLSVNDLSQNILEKYISQYDETIDYRSNQKVADLIGTSQLTTDLNNILSPYSVIVNKTSIDGLMYYVPQDSRAGTKPVLDGIVIFKLVPID